MSLFTSVISKAPKKHAFDLSFENLLTAEFGQLIPIVCKEVLPGDKFRMNTEILVKTAPLLAPIYSRIDAYMYTFFVPNRLIQTDWEDFITTGTDGLSTNLVPVGNTLAKVITQQPNIPVGATPAIKNGSLSDYMNMPYISATSTASISALAGLYINMLNFGAYQKVYSDWFRDELLDSFEFEPKQGTLSDSDTQTWLTLRYRAWRKDYFTSARPNTQLGAPIPIPVTGNISPDGDLKLSYPYSASANGNISLYAANEEASGSAYKTTLYGFGNTGNVLSYAEGLKLSSGEVSVIELRRALRLQEWQERNMRGGNRYIENIKQHFGVTSSDARLQRSQYLGGRKVPVVISEIPQTSATDSVTPQGNLAGRASASGRSKYVKFFAEEHGFIITILSIMPKAGYMQGLPKMYWRKSYLDYPWPLLANIGEMEVKKGELFLDQANFDQPFGYQSQYADMKFSNNECHGSFRDSMSFYHNYRIFSNAPVLNSDFVHLEDPGTDDSSIKPQNRIFPTLPSGYGHFYVQTWNDIKVVRALPRYGIPTI